VLKTPQIVFPALLDLDCPKGDVVRGGGSGGDSTLPNSASDSSGQEGPEDTHQKINWSVSYFNWSVSDEDEEVDTVTLSLDRIRIRRSSRERNQESTRNQNNFVLKQ